MPKRQSTFTNDLKREYTYLKETVDDKDKVRCNHCMAVFSISHDERSDIDKHSQTQKHKSSIEAAASSSRVTNFFKPANSDQSLKLAAKEASYVCISLLFTDRASRVPIVPQSQFQNFLNLNFL